MKGVIALLLTLGALGSPLSLGEFFAGYSEGVMDYEGCLANPAQCGESLGKLVSSLRSLLEDKPLETYVGITTAEVQLFIQGLVSGLRKNENEVSACVNDFTQGSYQATSFYNAIIALLQNSADWQAYVTFACSGVDIVGYEFINDCNFEELWTDITRMSLQQLLSNYLSNSCGINTAAIGLVNCSTANLGWCGYSAGVVIRELIGWGI